MADEDKGKYVAIAILIASTVVQIITFMFLWKPEKFRETVDKLKSILKKGKEKVVGADKKAP